MLCLFRSLICFAVTLSYTSQQFESKTLRSPAQKPVYVVCDVKEFMQLLLCVIYSVQRGDLGIYTARTSGESIILVSVSDNH